MHGIIPAPSNLSERAHWRDHLQQWRESTRCLLGYDDSIYTRPEFKWITRTFTLGFVMMNDLLFYNDGYQLDSFLEHGQREFGGYDALILWHAYPRIGFDQRNQFDFYRDMPGGLQRLRELVSDCHQRGVRVYVNYNPWDTGTRRQDMNDLDALVDLIQAIDADAIFLDTMAHSAEGLREKLDAVRPGVTLESEVIVPLEHIHTHPSSWAQSIEDVRGVLRNKWFERRHMQHRIKRWQHDHTPELHTAWMNGTGMVVWENVFGTWRGWNERDKSLLRAMVGIQRQFADLFAGEGWTPLVETFDTFIEASLWQDQTTRLWTLINTANETNAGHLLAVEHQEGALYYDLIRGQQIQPRIANGHAVINNEIRLRGIAAFLSVNEETPDLRDFLAQQAAINARANFDPTPPQLTETLRPTPTTRKYAAAELPVDMVAVQAHTFEMNVTMQVRECGFFQVPGVTFPGLQYRYLHCPFSFTRHVELSPFAIDLTPVTNAQFALFIQATDYKPPHPDYFLAHWTDGHIPNGLENHPVVYVSLEDARAYAEWAGKRLPTDAEWQFAAEGIEARRYPWGDEWRTDLCNYGQYKGTTPVKQFEGGRSPFGLYDMCGNVWEWTESERSDGRTRFALLKGGSFYKAQGSEWYADGGPQTNDFAAKFLLMVGGLDRCSTIGFRCAVDL